MDYPANVGGGNSEFVCQTVLKFSVAPSASDLQDRGFGQPGRSLLRSLGMITASLVLSVLHVIGLRTEKQVGRIAAGRVIAPVQDAHAIGDVGSVLHSPRNTVGELPLASDSEVPVALLIPAAGKGPTIDVFSDSNARPETVLQTTAIEKTLGNGTLSAHCGLTSVMSLGGTFAASPPSYCAISQPFLQAASSTLCNRREKE